MNAKRFWEIIDNARIQAGDWEEMKNPLTDMLSSLDISDIIKWQKIFEQYQHLSNKNKLWAAAYVINGGCSDDGFEYFRGWLTAQGRDVFINALNDPDSLAAVKACEGGSVDFEEMLYIAADAYFKKLNISHDYDLFYDEADKYPLSDAEISEIVKEIKFADDIDAEWDESDENCLNKLLPKLCAAFDW